MKRPRPVPSVASNWFLAVDAGNTRTKFGVFWEADCLAPAARSLPICRGFWAIGVDELLPWETFANSGFLGDPVAAVLTGSNPVALDRLQQSWPNPWPSAVRRSDPQSFPIVLQVDAPDRVGIDRVLNAVAGNHLRPADTAAIIVDSGTALTVEVVSAAGAFIGGSISPGLNLGARALYQYTALLPEISRKELESQTPAAIGKNTIDALRAGLYWGHVGLVREIVQQISRTLPPPRPLLLLTGGAGPLLAPHFPEARLEQSLSLQGIAVSHYAKQS